MTCRAFPNIISLLIFITIHSHFYSSTLLSYRSFAMFAEAGLLSNALAWALLLSAPFVDAVANIDMTAIGASTTLSQKPKVCNILDYGGVADGKMDVGPAISKAFSSCVSGNAATLYVPKGNYSRMFNIFSQG